MSDEKTDVTVVDEKLPSVPGQPSDPFLEMVSKLAENPDIDADKIEKFLDMQERVLDRNAKTEFYAAMNRVQANMPQVARDAVNDQTRSMYAKLETINKYIKPIYTQEGFSASFSQTKADTEGYIRIEGVLRHRDGHSEDHYATEVPKDTTGIKGSVNKTEMHGTGSAFTYGRRYLTCMMFDVAVGDDTDGNPVGSLDPITADQAIEIEDRMVETGTNKQAFLKWAGCESVDGMPAKKYKDAIAFFDRKGASNGDS